MTAYWLLGNLICSSYPGITVLGKADERDDERREFWGEWEGWIQLLKELCLNIIYDGWMWMILWY